jgi:two-component system C4-dicarboxylate transport response regulator DctD
MQTLCAQIASAARSDDPVLIVGERGAGKDLVARVLHDASARRGPLVAFRCGTIPEALAHSELFGHLRGGFPGAYRDKRGLVWRAHGGSLFLQDLAELSPRFQDVLRQLARTGAVRPIGDAGPVGAIDVRLIIAATADRKPDAAVGMFPANVEDRLTTVTLRIPPLRERPQDILLLLQQFAQTAHDGARPRLTAGAERLLLDHRWPGNVRELQGVAARLAGRPTITARDVAAHLHVA